MCFTSDLWLMSCRVLKRDMELAMLDSWCSRPREEESRACEDIIAPQKRMAWSRIIMRSWDSN